MSSLGPVRVIIISLAAAHSRSYPLLSGVARRYLTPLPKPVTTVVDGPTDAPLAKPLTAFVEGPCSCDSFCLGVQTANSQANPSKPVPPPPPQGWGPSQAVSAPNYDEAPEGSSSPILGMRQKNGRLVGVRSLISLESRPRSEAAREALYHGASAALLQQHVATYAYSSHTADGNAQQQKVGQPLGPRREPGMHCNCHCNHDPWFYMRGTMPPFDWSLTPAPMTKLPAPPPCSGTGQEWPGCPAPMRTALHVPLGGLPGLPKLLPVTKDDLPTLGPAPGVWEPANRDVRPGDATPMPPGPPPDPERPPPPPPPADPGSPPEVPEITAAGPVKDCVGPHGPIVCPPDPLNQNGWWGKPRQEKDIYYVAGADPNKQDALTGR